MTNQIIDFTTDRNFIHRINELKTIKIMIRLFCQHHHHSQTLCTDCNDLMDYAHRRLQRCIFGDAKPTCANCLVHCYSAEKRERIRLVMRWAGPRMLLRHPILAISHLLDGRRAIVKLPVKGVTKKSG